MLMNAQVTPTCPRCGGSVMSPVAWPAITIGGGVYLILCPSCGCVMGSVNKTGEEDAGQAAPGQP